MPRAPSIADASGLQYSLDVGPDLVVFDEFPALSGGDAPGDALTKTGVFPQQPQGGIFHQLFSVGTTVIGNLRKLGFLLGSEMNFHTPSD